ncbi:MAG TPA: methylenetetrahydrofolate reductase [Solirubrobacteraceae bacterium]|nr:methylenetetrahydrofolate reductase [Solirubrobacteraceae bacterium]
MEPLSHALGDSDARFEILPLGSSEEQAAQLPEPVRLTVTCSPKHGPDRSVEVAGRLRAMGHAVTVHVAARMVRDRAHLDELLGEMADAGADDLFLIGGDADPPLGEFASAVELLPLVAEHPQRPRTIGIGGYPEGHPLIDDATLEQALLTKSQHADYVTTQLCFDPVALTDWIAAQRRRGIVLPVLIGMPGKVMAARLLEMSARIGVGPSMAFVRKQRGLRNLFGLFRRSAGDDLHTALAPLVGDPQLGIAGFHYFTFNQLIATYEWQRETRPQAPRRAGREPAARGYPRPEESRT